MGKTGSCSDGRAMLSKSLIQFSADGWGCVLSLPTYRTRPNYGRGNGSNVASFERTYASMPQLPGLL